MLPQICLLYSYKKVTLLLWLTAVIRGLRCLIFIARKCVCIWKRWEFHLCTYTIYLCGRRRSTASQTRAPLRTGLYASFLYFLQLLKLYHPPVLFLIFFDVISSSLNIYISFPHPVCLPSPLFFSFSLVLPPTLLHNALSNLSVFSLFTYICP